MENEENQNQVSLRFPPPLEIAPRFPQSHNPDDDSPLPKTQNQKARKEPQRLKKPQPPSSGSSFDEKMLPLSESKSVRSAAEERRARIRFAEGPELEQPDSRCGGGHLECSLHLGDQRLSVFASVAHGPEQPMGFLVCLH